MKRVRIHPSKRARIDALERKANLSADSENSSDFRIGYGKPPKHTRFKPGQSGNPSGRPAGSKNRVAALARERDALEAIILEEADRKIKLREGDREVSMPAKKAVVRSTMNNAIKGSVRAQHLSTRLMLEVESKMEHRRYECAFQALELKKRQQAECDRRIGRGLSTESVLPKPQDIVVNFETGAVEIRGPIHKEEAALFDRCRSLQGGQLDELHYWQEQVDDPRSVNRNQARREVETSEAVLQIFGHALRGNRDALALICGAYDDVMTRLHDDGEA
jgi:hypothetical protein